MAKTSVFRGLNNTAEELTLGLGWLRTADNIDVTKEGKIRRREGFAQALACTPSSGYTTRDFARMYVVDAGALKQMVSPSSAVTLRTGLAAAPMYWDELNGDVYFTNGIDSGIVTQAGEVLDWRWPVPTATTLAAVNGTLPAGLYQATCTYLLRDGRETGTGPVSSIELTAGQGLQLSQIPTVANLLTLVYIAPANATVFQFAFAAAGAAAVWNGGPNSLGADLVTHQRAPLPAGATMPTLWQGRMCAATFSAARDSSTVWMSDGLAPHLFDLVKGFFMVPGEAVLVAPTTTALIVGTRTAIYAYADGVRTQLADYGCPPGHNWTRDGVDNVLLWTNRGLCRALPFANLTERNVSVAPGDRVGLALIERNGAKRAVVVLQSGGTAFNAHTPYVPTAGDALLLENGDYLLLENGDRLLLE